MKNLFFYLFLMLPAYLFAQYPCTYVNVGIFSTAKLSKHVSGAPSSVNATCGYLHPLSKQLSISANAMYFYAQNSTFDSLFRVQNSSPSPISFDLQDGIKRGFTTSTFLLSIGLDSEFNLENKNKIGVQAAFGMAYMDYYREFINTKIKSSDGALLFEAEDSYGFNSKIFPVMTLGVNIGRKIMDDLDIFVGMKYIRGLSKTPNFELEGRNESYIGNFPQQVDISSLASHRNTIGEQQRSQFLSLEVGFRYWH